MLNKVNKYILLLFLIVAMLNLKSVSGISTYNETGNEGNFRTDSTIMNQNFINDRGLPDSFTRLLSDGKGHALVSDLDNDGISEIIVQDGNSIKLYNNRQLNQINSFSFDISANGYSNMISFDIDNDGFNEIIIARDSQEDLMILQYNGTDFFNETTLSWNTDTHTDGDSMVKCRDSNNCILAYNANNTAPSSITNMLSMVKSFNSTNFVDEKPVANTSTGTIRTWCFPKVKDIQVDRQSSGNPLYYYSAFEDHIASVDDHFRIFRVKVEDDLEISVNQTFHDEDLGISLTGGNPASCDENPNGANKISSPLVMDADTGGNNEVVIAHQVSSNEFEIKVYDFFNNEINHHPASFEASGQILSNPIPMKAFPDSETARDYCVMGFVSSESEYDCDDGCLDLLCGSMLSSRNFLDTIEYFYMDTTFNNSLTERDRPDTITHQITASEQTTMDEVINNHGIFQLTENDICGTDTVINDLCLERIFESGGFSDASIIPVDAEKTGKQDIIGVTEAQLFYIDDKFSNSPPTVCPFRTSCQFNPCIDSVWKVNTTVQVTVEGSDDDDADDDLVAYKVISYFGDSNEMDSGYSANVTPLDPNIVFSFQANKTIANGIIRIQATDTFAYDSHIDTRDVPFTVAESGLEFGDSTCFIEGSQEDGEDGTNETGIVTELRPDNPVTSFVGRIAERYGFTSLIVWVLIMLGVGIFLFFISMFYFHQHPLTIINLIGLIEFGFLIVGALFGIVSIGIIIIIAIFGIAIITIQIRSAATGVK